jgi:hypothetical protein
MSGDKNNDTEKNRIKHREYDEMPVVEIKRHAMIMQISRSAQINNRIRGNANATVPCKNIYDDETCNRSDQ